eukprot:scaffold3513_cov127-Isochrysis_galbana.AAC.11
MLFRDLTAARQLPPPCRYRAAQPRRRLSASASAAMCAAARPTPCSGLVLLPSGRVTEANSFCLFAGRTSRWVMLTCCTRQRSWSSAVTN